MSQRPGRKAPESDASAPDRGSGGGLVTVARYASLLDAQLARVLLAAHGVEAHVPDERSASVLGEQFDSLGGIRVMVRAGAAERAAALLQPEAPEALEAPQVARCSVCGTPRPRNRPSLWTRIWGRVAPSRSPLGRACGICGYRPERASGENPAEPW